MISNNPLVSIIVPVYNCERYIKECVDSLVNQSYTNLEIIIIDDGSKDNSGAIIEKYFLADSRVKYIHKENGGVSKARNTGINLASGKFISFVDGDDYVSLNFIEAALDLIQANNLDFVLGGTQRYSQNGSKNYAASTENVIIYENDLFDLKAKVLSNGTVPDKRLNTCFTSGPVCKLFKSDQVKKLEFNESLTTGEDTVFNLQMLETVRRVGVVADIWYYYRINEASATNVYNPNIKSQCEMTLAVLEKMYGLEEAMKPYFKVKVIQQFHSMLILNPLHKDSGMSYWKVRIFIKDTLSACPWNRLLAFDCMKKIPSHGIDTILSICCMFRAVDLIYFFVKIRLKMKQR